MVEMCTLFIILEYKKYVCLLRNADRYDYKGRVRKVWKKIHTFFLKASLIELNNWKMYK